MSDCGRSDVDPVPVRPARWRTRSEVEELLLGPADPDWARDRELVDDDVRDPWASR